MKEASGELSMTLIVIVAAGAVLAIFMLFRQPIVDYISKMWGNVVNTDTSNDKLTVPATK